MYLEDLIDAHGTGCERLLRVDADLLQEPLEADIDAGAPYPKQRALREFGEERIAVPGGPRQGADEPGVEPVLDIGEREEPALRRV